MRGNDMKGKTRNARAGMREEYDFDYPIN